MTGQALTLAVLLPVTAAVVAWLVLWDTRRAVRARVAHARTLRRAAFQAHLDLLLAGNAYVCPAPSLWDDQWRRDLAAFYMEERVAMLVLRPESFTRVTGGTTA